MAFGGKRFTTISSTAAVLFPQRGVDLGIGLPGVCRLWAGCVFTRYYLTVAFG